MRCGHVPAAPPELDWLVLLLELKCVLHPLEIAIFACGGMDEFRDLLVKLGGVPYLQHIDDFKLQTMEASHQLRFGLTLWLNQE